MSMRLILGRRRDHKSLIAPAHHSLNEEVIQGQDSLWQRIFDYSPTPACQASTAADLPAFLLRQGWWSHYRSRLILFCSLRVLQMVRWLQLLATVIVRMGDSAALAREVQWIDPCRCCASVLLGLRLCIGYRLMLLLG